MEPVGSADSWCT